MATDIRGVQLSAPTVTLTLNSLPVASWRQSTVVDFTAIFGLLVKATLFAKYGSAPTAGGVVLCRFIPSVDASTHGAGCSGSDSAYTAGLHLGYAPIVRIPLLASTVVQDNYGIFDPAGRYGNFIVSNPDASQAFDSASCLLVLSPYTPQFQA